MKKIITLIIVSLLSISLSYAQESDTLQREVTITKEFTPTVRDAEKINTLPSIATPTFNTRSVNYCYDATSTAVPTTATNVNIPYLPKYETGAKRHRGYLDLGLGTYLSMFANAGYHILDTPHDQLNIKAQFSSLNWDIPVNSHSSMVSDDDVTHQTFYDARAGLRYTHTFDNDISVSLQGAYRYINFNYYGVAGNALRTTTHPFNTVNNFYGEVRVDNKEAQHYDYEHWYVTAGYSLYKNSRGAYTDIMSNEHHAYAKSAYDYMLDEFWSIGGEVNLDYLQYNGLLNKSTQNIFMARLIPNITYRKNRLYFRAGFKTDISVNDGTVFRFAPDIHFNWEFVENYFLHADIDGGKQLHTWYDMSQYCLYFDPSLRVPSTYSPFDAQLGFRFRFIPELYLSAYAGYEVATSALFQSAALSTQAIAWQGLEASCFKAGARINADILQYVTISLEAIYRHWTHDGAAISYNRPRWEGNANVAIHPHKQFDIELGYNMQLGRDFGATYGTLNDIHNLQAMVTYHPAQWLSVFVQGNNLINCKYDYYYGMPAPRIQAMVGAELKF